MVDAINHIGQQRLVVQPTEVKGLTMPAGFQPQHVLITVHGASVRWRADGFDPTPTLGTLVPAAERHQVLGDNIIDWTAPQTRYQSMIRRVRFVMAEGEEGQADLDVAYFD